MRAIRLTPDNIEQAAKRAVTVLRSGGVVLFPTDTLYGLGADAFSNEAVEKVFLIKGRDDRKPMHGIVADLGMAMRYADFNNDALALAQTFWPGALTLVLKKKDGILLGIARDRQRIGLRVPDDAFCRSVAKRLGSPYTATSANRSGQRTEHTVEKILDQFGNAARYIDLVIDAGELPHREPSTVVAIPLEVTHRKAQGFLGEPERFAYGPPEILREGAIHSDRILSAIPKES